MNPMHRVSVDALSPDAAAIGEAAAVIRAAGVVALPTDTLYGLAANPWCANAVARVFEAKERSADRALPLVAADLLQVAGWVGPLPPAALRLAQRFWPGPLTLLVAAPIGLGLLSSRVTGATGQIAIRVPAHAVPRALCEACGYPLTATSANVSGEPASADPDEVALALKGRIDMLLDAGRAPGGQPSTIVEVSGNQLRLVRAGAIPWNEVRGWVESE
jgi:L-threonylcarbamoyladenylate synthase